MTTQTIKTVRATASSLTFTSNPITTLASANYAASDAYNLETNQPNDLAVEATIVTTNTPSGNKQVLVFIKESIDGGTSFRSGPETGSTATDEPDLLLIGYVPMNSSGTHRGSFSVAQRLGYVPTQVKVVLKNDMGVAFTTGSVVKVQEISQTVG